MNARFGQYNSLKYLIEGIWKLAKANVTNLVDILKKIESNLATRNYSTAQALLNDLDRYMYERCKSGGGRSMT